MRYTKFILLIFLLPISIVAKDYHVSADGNDSNDGSIDSPWKSLAKVSKAGNTDKDGGFIMPGDRVLFRSGDTFYGNLVFRRSGTVENPIVISSYGQGEYPIISGSGGDIQGGDYFEAIKLLNTNNIVLTKLWIKNDRKNNIRYTYGSTNSFGIQVVANKWGTGVISNMVFRDLKFSDVFGVDMPDEFNSLSVTGLRFTSEANETDKDIAISDVLVEDCYFTHLGKAGVWAVHKGSHKLDDPLYNRNRNFVIRNNTFYKTGGSGVILSKMYNGLLENNDFDHTGNSEPDESRLAGRGSGAWLWTCYNIVAQYNRSYSVRGKGDSYGMHIDFGNTNVIFQYNYSEDSAGGFCEILGNNLNSTYRFNVSVNDGIRDVHGYTLWMSGFVGKGIDPIPSNNNYVYNNSIYLDIDGRKPDISIFAKNTYVYNNIFSSIGGAAIGSEEVHIDIEAGSELKVSNNLFHGDVATAFTKLDNSKISNQNPLYVDPVSASKSGLNIEEQSPAVNAGMSFPEPDFPMAGQGIFKDISSNSLVDAFSNKVDIENSIPNIGASNAYNSGQLSIEQNEVNLFKIFPNPVKESLNLSLDFSNKNTELNIYSISGELVFKDQFRSSHKQSINLPSNIKNGIYILKISQDEYSQSKRLILYR